MKFAILLFLKILFGDFEGGNITSTIHVDNLEESGEDGEDSIIYVYNNVINEVVSVMVPQEIMDLTPREAIDLGETLILHGYERRKGDEVA